MKKIIFTLTMVCLQPAISHGFCLFHCEEKVDQVPNQALIINPIETSEQAQLAQQTLSDLAASMGTKFTEVENKIRQGDAASALKQAKEILDTVRVKVGIDPKVKMRESFYVPIKFSDDVAQFNDLSDYEKNEIIRTIRDFRGGLYMDLMNLSKRTTLIYSRAFKSELKAQGGLNEEDRKKIIKDLVTACLIPMTVVDKAGKKITVFDEDVANEDHTYLFNRELKMDLLSDKDLQIKEEDFLKYKDDIRAVLLGRKIAKKTSPPTKGMQCMFNADAIGDYPSMVVAQSDCFYAYYEATQTFAECNGLAKKIYEFSISVPAQVKCADKFQ